MAKKNQGTSESSSKDQSANQQMPPEERSPSVAGEHKSMTSSPKATTGGPTNRKEAAQTQLLPVQWPVIIALSGSKKKVGAALDRIYEERALAHGDSGEALVLLRQIDMGHAAIAIQNPESDEKVSIVLTCDPSMASMEVTRTRVKLAGKLQTLEELEQLEEAQTTLAKI